MSAGDAGRLSEALARADFARMRLDGDKGWDLAPEHIKARHRNAIGHLVPAVERILFRRLAARHAPPDEPGGWRCGYCGRSGPEHALGGTTGECVYDPVWVPLAPLAPPRQAPLGDGAAEVDP